MVNLKKILSPPTRTQANPYANPFNPNHPLRIDPKKRHNSVRPPTVSTIKSELTARQNEDVSPRGSMDLLAEARRVVGRDPVTGKPATCTPPNVPAIASLAVRAGEKPGEEPDFVTKTKGNGEKEKQKEVKEKKSKSRLWGKVRGTKKEKEKDKAKQSTAAAASIAKSMSPSNNNGNSNIRTQDKGKGKQPATAPTSAPATQPGSSQLAYADGPPLGGYYSPPPQQMTEFYAPSATWR